MRQALNKADKGWGVHVGGWYFWLADDSVFMTAHRMPGKPATGQVPFEGDRSDPRTEMRRLANTWCRERG